MRLNLRLRVALTLMVFGIALIAAQTLAIFAVTEEQEEEFIDRIVADEMRSLARAYRLDPNARPPHGSKLQGYVVETAAQRTALPAALQALPPGSSEVWIDDREYHVNVAQENGTTLMLLYDATEHERRIAEFRFFLLGALALSALVTVSLGLWLGGRLARPVTELASKVDKLDPTAVHPPLAPHYADPEPAALARALDRYHGKVAELLQREKDFTAYVSHEVRTPLTALKTGCELLAGEPGLSEKGSRRVAAMGQAVDRLDELLRALLFLAREIPLDQTDEVNLAELAQELAAPLRAAAAQKGVELALRVPPGARVATHRPALALALANLMKNAVDYTDHGTVSVEFADGVLSVSDTGQGMAEAELPELFAPFRRGSNARPGGTGLGLAIVKRVAERFGWTLRASSSLGRGSRFSIVFAPERASQ